MTLSKRNVGAWVTEGIDDPKHPNGWGVGGLGGDRGYRRSIGREEGEPDVADVEADVLGYSGMLVDLDICYSLRLMKSCTTGCFILIWFDLKKKNRIINPFLLRIFKLLYFKFCLNFWYLCWLNFINGYVSWLEQNKNHRCRNLFLFSPVEFGYLQELLSPYSVGSAPSSSSGFSEDDHSK